MSKDGEVYIGSISPTIGVKQQRDLFHCTKTMMGVLTNEEFMAVMKIYYDAVNRIFKENGIEEDSDEI